MTRRPDDVLEAAASRFREKYDIRSLQCPDIDYLLEKVSVDLDISLVRRFDDDMPHEEASTDCNTRTIYYRETLRHRLRSGDKRARFVFMEEIAHIVLGHSGVRHRSLTHKIYEKSVAQVRNEESEARYFAAAVLAPSDFILSDWDALKISEFFQISLQAAEIRKEQVERIKRIISSQRRELPNCVVDFLKEAKCRGYPVQTIIE